VEILLFFPTKNIREKNVEFYFNFNFLTRGNSSNFAHFFPHVESFCWKILTNFSYL